MNLFGKDTRPTYYNNEAMLKELQEEIQDILNKKKNDEKIYISYSKETS